MKIKLTFFLIFVGVISSSLVGVNFAQAVVTDDVTSLYSSILGRDPDPSGFDYYVDRLNSGVSLDQITQEISGSSEAQVISGNQVVLQIPVGGYANNGPEQTQEANAIAAQLAQSGVLVNINGSSSYRNSTYTISAASDVHFFINGQDLGSTITIVHGQDSLAISTNACGSQGGGWLEGLEIDSSGCNVAFSSGRSTSDLSAVRVSPPIVIFTKIPQACLPGQIGSYPNCVTPTTPTTSSCNLSEVISCGCGGMVVFDSNDCSAWHCSASPVCAMPTKALYSDPPLDDSGSGNDTGVNNSNGSGSSGSGAGGGSSGANNTQGGNVNDNVAGGGSGGSSGNAGGSGLGSIVIPITIDFFTASPSRVLYNKSMTLAWKATGATRCTIVGRGVESARITDNMTVGASGQVASSRLKESTDFTLSCTNNNSGSASKTLKIQVLSLGFQEI